jgi:hypothetical protein
VRIREYIVSVFLLVFAGQGHITSNGCPYDIGYTGTDIYNLRAKASGNSAETMQLEQGFFYDDMPLYISADGFIIKQVIAFGEKGFIVEADQAGNILSIDNEIFLEGEFADSALIDNAIERLLDTGYTATGGPMVTDTKFRPLIKEIVKWYSDVYAGTGKRILLFDESGPAITGIGTKDAICISTKFIKNDRLNAVLLFNKLFFAYMDYLLDSDATYENAYNLRDNIFSQLPDGSRRWVAAERNKYPPLALHYTIRAWQRLAFDGADRYLTEVIGSMQADSAKTSSAGDIGRYRQQWSMLRKGEITEDIFLRSVDLYELAKISDYITADPREAAILHKYLHDSFPDYHDMIKFSERRKMYKALLRPEAGLPHAKQRFLDIFDRAHPRTLMFRIQETERGIITRGILNEKDLMMLVLIYAARQGSLTTLVDNTVLKWRHGKRVHFNRDDKDIISNLGGVRPGTKNMGALNRLVKSPSVYIPEVALYGFNQRPGILRWMADGIYTGIEDIAQPAQQMDLFEFSRPRLLIDQAA